MKLCSSSTASWTRPTKRLPRGIPRRPANSLPVEDMRRQPRFLPMGGNATAVTCPTLARAALQRRLQHHILDQTVQIVGMHAEQAGGFLMVVVGLLKRPLNHRAFCCVDRVVQ